MSVTNSALTELCFTEKVVHETIFLRIACQLQNVSSTLCKVNFKIISHLQQVIKTSAGSQINLSKTKIFGVFEIHVHNHEAVKMLGVSWR